MEVVTREVEIIDSDAVIIQPLPIETCDRCDERGEDDAPPVPATRIIALDIAQLGQSTTIGVYCDLCADDVAAELRAALAVADRERMAQQEKALKETKSYLVEEQRRNVLRDSKHDEANARLLNNVVRRALEH